MRHPLASAVFLTGLSCYAAAIAIPQDQQGNNQGQSAPANNQPAAQSGTTPTNISNNVGPPVRVQGLGDYLDSLVHTNFAGNNELTSEADAIFNTVVHADWFGDYTVDYESPIPGVLAQPQRRATSDAALAKRRPASQLNHPDAQNIEASFRNTSSGAGYILIIPAQTCVNVQVGTYNDPTTGSGSTDGSLGSFAKAYVTAQKTDAEWRTWTQGNVLVVINRFLSIVDSPQCILKAVPQGTPQFYVGQNLWTANFVNTVAHLGASFGPDVGTPATDAQTTTTPTYNNAIGYVVAVCHQMLMRLQVQVNFGKFEVMMLNLFAQFAANIAGNWEQCTDGSKIAADMAKYINGFQGSEAAQNALQQIAAPVGQALTVQGGDAVWSLNDICLKS